MVLEPNTSLAIRDACAEAVCAAATAASDGWVDGTRLGEIERELLARIESLLSIENLREHR